MSSVLPSDRRLLVQFGLDHNVGWTTNAAAIGLSSAQALLFKNQSSAAKTAFDAATLAHTQAKAATAAYYAACGTFRDTAASCVRSIKAFADVAADPAAIYALAAIPAPQPRSHTGQPPAQPTDITAGLETDGSITLRWKCANPTGVSRVNYIIQRKLDGETGFSALDFVGEKTYNDATLPRGVDGVSYIITGKAGQQTGPASAMFTLSFGSVGGGGGWSGASVITSNVEMPATTEETQDVKLAA
jgi:hypothetical protein